ncbi:MAG: hypothetical protein C0502_05600 [Opitutus sp.]|nr:hypothetical protein [Opitutus sp.]
MSLRALSRSEVTVLLFRRILNFRRSSIAAQEKRRSERYPVGGHFPLSAALTLLADPAAAGRKNWKGEIVDLSSTGASLRLAPAFSAGRGDTCMLGLELEDYLIDVPARVAHCRAQPGHMRCGLEIELSDYRLQKPYLQLLEPLSLGNSLRPVPAKLVRQEGGQHTEAYSGESEARLSLWREKPGGRILSFEFRLHGCFVRGSADSGEIRIMASEGWRSDVGGCYSLPSFRVSVPRQTEVRRLLRWTVANLHASVPADAQKFLARVLA